VVQERDALVDICTITFVWLYKYLIEKVWIEIDKDTLFIDD
jgi:hypothetical protein